MKLHLRQDSCSVNATQPKVTTYGPKESAIAANSASPPPEAQARITWASRVANCLDTLKVSFWVNWFDSKILEQLEEAKQAAQATEFDSEPIDLAGHTFNCHRSGTKLFTYRLVKGDATLLFHSRSPESTRPNARLEIGSMSCWAPGYQKNYDEFIKLVELLGGVVVKELVSEAHLCADFIGLAIDDVPVQHEDYWITPAHNFNYRSNRRKFSYVSFGKGDLMLRVYDKALELQNNAHKKELFLDVWGLDSLEGVSVTRVEYQIRRPVFSSFNPNVNTLEELKDSLKALWGYCTAEWTRLVERPVDRNHHQSRAVIHPWWQQVQATEWKGNKFVERKKDYARKDMERICKLLAGTGMSAAAKSITSLDDIEEVFNFAHANLEKNLRDMFQRDPALFVKKMARKINEVNGPFQSEVAE